MLSVSVDENIWENIMTNEIKYHVNKKTGRAGVCRATKKGCPLGEDTPHFASIKEANTYIEGVERENNQAIISHNKVKSHLIYDEDGKINLDNNIMDKDKDYVESEEFKGKLTTEELAAIKDYLDVDYMNINADLWEGKKNNKADIINAALDKGASINNSEKVLYRKPAFSPELSKDEIKEAINSYKVGDVINFQGITSTTRDPNVMMTLLADKPKPSPWDNEDDLEILEDMDQSYKNIIYEIRTKNGVSMSALSDFPQEAEYLIGSNTNFRVDEIRKNQTIISSKDIHGNSAYRKERSTTIIMLTQV